MNKWLFNQMDLQELATVTRVSNFVEENVCECFFYIVKAPRPGAFMNDSVTHCPTC